MRRIKPFQYYEPATVPEAVEILAREGKGAYPLAGGTDLLVRMKRGDLIPSALVNLKRIEGLKGIEKEDGKGLHIGSLVPISAIEDSLAVRSSHSVLAEAAGLLGSRSIRNLGTLGGNIGRASPASDMAPALIVLGAKVAAEGPKGKREMEVERFFKRPGATALDGGELIVSFYVPEMEKGSRAVYLRLGRREGMDCALVGVAVRVVFSGTDTGLRDARIVLASVGPTPMRAIRVEKELLSGSLTQERIGAAARLAMDECLPITDLRASGEYRREMIGVLVRRALETARTETVEERR